MSASGVSASGFEEARASFEKVGYSVCRGVIQKELTDRVTSAVDDVVKSPQFIHTIPDLDPRAPLVSALTALHQVTARTLLRQDIILVHKEVVGDGSVAPARIERFVNIPGPLQDACEEARKLAEKVTGRQLRMFKDKVNFKYPGGGTFLPHQDSPAYYPHGSWHVSVLLPLTPFRGQNGTLEVADTLSSAVPMEDLKSIKYEPVSLNTGDILVFDGLVPHQSGPNATTKPRVGMYLTYTDVREGDVSESYYAAKAAGIEGMSLNQVDFTGKLVKSNL